MSWLNTGQTAATVPVGEGQFVILAVYENGRYIQPEIVQIPDSPASLFGPDGPVQMTQQPQAEEEDEDDDGDQ